MPPKKKLPLKLPSKAKAKASTAIAKAVVVKKATPKAAPNTPKVPKNLSLAANPFTTLSLLSAGDDLTGAEAELKLRTVARHLHAPMPSLVRIAGVEASTDLAALALYRAFRAHGRGGRALYVVGTSPLHTPTQGALSILTTDWGNTVLAANDGTMALLAHLFDLRGIAYKLAPLDMEKIIEKEQERMQNPDWQPAPDFALRDLLAPAAAMLLAGTPMEDLIESTSTRTNAAGPRALETAFVGQLSTLPLHLGRTLLVSGIPLGNNRYLLNLTTDPLTFDQLLDDRARFKVTVDEKPRLWPMSVGVGGAHSTYTPLVQLSPIQAPAWDERFLVAQLNPCNTAEDKLCHFHITRVQ